jgi:hypothetical protein
MLMTTGDRDRQEQERHSDQITRVDAVRVRQREQRRSVPQLDPEDGADDGEREDDTRCLTNHTATEQRRHLRQRARSERLLGHDAS